MTTLKVSNVFKYCFKCKDVNVSTIDIKCLVANVFKYYIKYKIGSCKLFTICRLGF